MADLEDNFGAVLAPGITRDLLLPEICPIVYKDICTTCATTSTNTLADGETYFDDLSGWGAPLSSCGENQIVGGYEIIAGGKLSKKFDLPQKGCMVKVELDYYKIDTWDNELATVLLNDEVMWSKRYAVRDGTEMCGRNNRPDQIDHVEFTATVSEETFTLAVAADLDQAAGDESFGFNNVQITPICPVSNNRQSSLLSTADLPHVAVEATTEFQINGDLGLDIEFSPNPAFILNITPPRMDIKSNLKFTFQSQFSDIVNLDQYELTEKQTLYSDFFLVGAVPITIKVSGQAVADVTILGQAGADASVSLNLDGQIGLTEEEIQLRLNMLTGELDHDDVEPSIGVTGFEEMWNFQFDANADLAIDVKVGIRLEVEIYEAISLSITPSVSASTRVSARSSDQCPEDISASAVLETSIDIGTEFLRNDGNNGFNIISLMDDNCNIIADQLTGGVFDWIEDFYLGLKDFDWGAYYDNEEFTVCDALFGILRNQISWDGSTSAAIGQQFDFNVLNAELFRFETPQVCLREDQAFMVNSRGQFTRPNPTPRPTPSPTPRPTTTRRPTPRPTPSPTRRTPRPTTTRRPTPRPTPSPTSNRRFCAKNSDCVGGRFCDHFLAFTCQKKRGRGSPCTSDATCRSGNCNFFRFCT